MRHCLSTTTAYLRVFPHYPDTERQVSAAAGSGSDGGADAVSGRLQTLVRPCCGFCFSVHLLLQPCGFYTTPHWKGPPGHALFSSSAACAAARPSPCAVGRCAWTVASGGVVAGRRASWQYLAVPGLHQGYTPPSAHSRCGKSLAVRSP